VSQGGPNGRATETEKLIPASGLNPREPARPARGFLHLAARGPPASATARSQAQAGAGAGAGALPGAAASLARPTSPLARLPTAHVVNRSHVGSALGRADLPTVDG
jgi:hypothetical protein